MKTLIAPTLVPSSGSINHAFEAGSREDHCFCNDHVEGLIGVGLITYSMWSEESSASKTIVKFKKSRIHVLNTTV